MKAIPVSIVEAAVKKFDSCINRYAVDLREKLEKLYVDNKLSRPQKKYIEVLIELSGKIITAKPKVLARYKKQFDKIITPVKMTGTAENKKFCSIILKALGYGSRRTDFYPKYFKELGIRVCIYCNSVPAISVKSNKKKKLVARFQVDHYLPKAEYPCFSVSLYNLYPACASCNNSKGIRKVHFQLYVTDIDIKQSEFYFRLSRLSTAKYILSRDSVDISYTFIEPAIKATDTESFDDVFAINGIYDTQKDIAEEIILKAEIYTDTYKKALEKEFSKILKSRDITNRLILSNYVIEQDLHKRPMAKFMIDIAKQVGLL